jgi:hypothetical protein
VNLRERDFALVERVGDALAFVEQPIPVTIRVEDTPLDDRGVIAVEHMEKTGERALHQNVFRPERRTISVDADASVAQTARVAKPYPRLSKKTITIHGF